MPVRLKCALALFDQTFDPGDEFLVGVIGVHDGANAVFLRQQMNVLRRRGRAQNPCAMRVGSAFAGIEARAAIRHLDDDVGLGFRRGFHHRIDGVGSDDVHRGQRIAAVFTGRNELAVFFAGDDAGAQSLGHFIPLFRSGAVIAGAWRSAKSKKMTTLTLS